MSTVKSKVLSIHNLSSWCKQRKVLLPISSKEKQKSNKFVPTMSLKFELAVKNET